MPESTCNHALGYWEGVGESALIDYNSSEAMRISLYNDWGNEVFKFCPRCGEALTFHP